MSRRKAREIALQTLFQLDYNDLDPNVALNIVINEFKISAQRTKAYAKQLVNGTCQHMREIDYIISSYSAEWKLERMPGIDRNITRMAIYEMKYSGESLTPGVVINEAVELAKIFGTDDSSRFINGILGAMIKNRG